MQVLVWCLKDKELLQNTKGDLAILASDITTETKAVFPDHTRLYYDKPGQVSPSEFVRMSMSIPVFFQPKEVSSCYCSLLLACTRSPSCRCRGQRGRLHLSALADLVALPYIEALCSRLSKHGGLLCWRLFLCKHYLQGICHNNLACSVYDFIKKTSLFLPGWCSPRCDCFGCLEDRTWSLL